MKKFLVVLLALVMALSMVSAHAETDKEYIVNKGVLVVGITDFAPMDYKDADGNWIGFDADLATAFAASLGVKVEFVEIDWDNKILELDSKTVDCIWNGMTLTDAVKAAMETSNPYMNNAQVVIVPAAKAEQYQTIESLADLSFAAEASYHKFALCADTQFFSLSGAFPVCDNDCGKLIEVGCQQGLQNHNAISPAACVWYVTIVHKANRLRHGSAQLQCLLNIGHGWIKLLPQLPYLGENVLCLCIDFSVYVLIIRKYANTAVQAFHIQPGLSHEY